MKQVKVVVTGATGQVAYALLPRIAAGEMFGPETEIDLRLSDIPQVIDKAKGVLMELEDCACPAAPGWNGETSSGRTVRSSSKKEGRYSDMRPRPCTSSWSEIHATPTA